MFHLDRRSKGEAILCSSEPSLAFLDSPLTQRSFHGCMSDTCSRLKARCEVEVGFSHPTSHSMDSPSGFSAAIGTSLTAARAGPSTDSLSWPAGKTHCTPGDDTRSFSPLVLSVSVLRSLP